MGYTKKGKEGEFVGSTIAAGTNIGRSMLFLGGSSVTSPVTNFHIIMSNTTEISICEQNLKKTLKK